MKLLRPTNYHVGPHFITYLNQIFNQIFINIELAKYANDMLLDCRNVFFCFVKFPDYITVATIPNRDMMLLGDASVTIWSCGVTFFIVVKPYIPANRH